MDKITNKIKVMDIMCDEYTSYFTRLKPILERSYGIEIAELQDNFDAYNKLKKQISKEEKKYDWVNLFKNIKSNNDSENESHEKLAKKGGIHSKKKNEKENERKNERKNEKENEKKDKDEPAEKTGKNKQNYLENIFYIFHLMCNMDIILIEIYNILSKFNLKEMEYSTSMSSTYVSETEVILYDLRRKYTTFKISNEKITLQIISEMTNIIENLIINNLPNALYTIHGFLEKYPKSIHLYANIMQKYINTEYTYIVADLVDNAKNIVLATINCISELVGGDYANPPISTFGLIPVCKSGDLHTIMETATKTTIQSKILKETDINDVGKKLSINIIILHKIVKNPLEFNIWNLFTDSDTQPSEIGLNNKLINRFSTIFRPTDTVKKSKIKAVEWDFSILHYGTDIEKSEKFIVLDTLDSVKYRILAPWKDSQNNILPRFRVSSLLHYMKDPNSLSRVNNYHKIMIKKAQNNMFLNNIVDFDKIEKTASIYESKYLKNTIYHELMEEYTTISKKYKFRNQIDFSNSIHDSQLYDKFSDLILQHYNEYLKTNENILNELDFPYSEILSTFLSYLKNLAVEFKKEMHTQYIKTSIDSNIFESKEKDIVKTNLNKVFQSILLNTLNTIITDETNIYQSALKKYQILLAK